MMDNLLSFRTFQENEYKVEVEAVVYLYVNI